MPNVPESNSGPAFGFPKSARILRRSDFRRVYDHGLRHSCPFFAAFCLRDQESGRGPAVGFTVPRAIGKAVVRNRVRRRMREAVRLRLTGLSGPWMIVFNPRRTVLSAPFDALGREVDKLFERCSNS